MFGFALWDARRRRLVVGRDRLGIKPLYLYRDAKRLAFASEAKALLALPGVQAAIEPSALHPYLNLGYVPAPASLFKNITKLPPATLLTIERGRAEQTRYWRIPHTVEREVAEGEWIERVRARLDEGVAMQMVSDAPSRSFRRDDSSTRWSD
jgi:asparagine synthase (glutamine-hydrolysing)